MAYRTLISATELAKHIDDPDWAIIDARFVLTEPERAGENYLKNHIPGAVYVHTDRDLSSPVIPSVTGRHPWLPLDKTVELFSRLGIDENVQVVAYDDVGGALSAVRVWWMLRWLGHDNAAVLDGGWQAWIYEELPMRGGIETRPPRKFTPKTIRHDLLVDIKEVDRMRQDLTHRVLDARSFERYQGKNETIDRVAGHIPGAVSAPYLDILTEDYTLRPVEELRAFFEPRLGGVPPERTAVYCGSGVTSILPILAMMYAGMGEAKLYAGSWSEWIADGTRPIAAGEKP
jgi:thiosulfate/3-mercaptopyruvate sulfurtransferase